MSSSDHSIIAPRSRLTALLRSSACHDRQSRDSAIVQRHRGQASPLADDLDAIAKGRLPEADVLAHAPDPVEMAFLPRRAAFA